MNFGHVADLHLGHRQYGLKQREDDMAGTFRATLQLATEHDPDAILLPGDLFHSRDLRPKVLDAAERGLKQVPDDIPVLVSQGNHDENLTTREVTWLNYLHQRGHIVVLEADLDSDSEGAHFDPHDGNTERGYAGFYDIESDSETVRVFGLQWRGARTDTALERVARGIQTVADERGEPDYTILLGHFGIEDEVPALGGNVTHAELREVREVVDYLALGHIHKRYDASGWIYNPGSPEAHSTSEARDDWDHGYYHVTLDAASEGYAGPGRLEHKVEHHHSRRRPFYTPRAFDITPYDSYGELEMAFSDHISRQQDALESAISDEEFLYQGERRQPIIDLRFQGTLQFERGDFRVDELADWVKDACDALYVQTNTSRVTSADIQELLAELDDDEVFVDGRLKTEALEQRVFETIATESQFGEHADEVATLLGTAHRMAQANEAVEDIVDLVTQRRREHFPDATESVSLDVQEDPFADREQEFDEEEVSEDARPNRAESEGSADEPLEELHSTDGGEQE